MELDVRKSPTRQEPSCGLVVVLSDGCRIEVHPEFDTNTFERLVSALERVEAVFGLGPATRIYLAAGVTDMRKGFEGLYGLVRDRLSCEPVSGHLFLFCNGQRNRLKVLVWDGSGLWVCSKRLEKRRFTWQQSGDAQGKVILSHEELFLLLGGIDLTKTKLLGGWNVAIDSGRSLTHCECSSHSFIASRSGTHRTTAEQARVRGSADSGTG